MGNEAIGLAALCCAPGEEGAAPGMKKRER